MAKTTDAIRILKQRIGPDPEFWRMVEEERLNAEIARMIYAARTKAGLTQAELANRIGTKQPAIARLEDANYNGRSLRLLHRIARVLNLRLTIDMKRPAKTVPIRRSRRS
jgi:ribosome-binding protein aMBF1 (putative translation factor)